jgi:hypothetical protein
MSSDNDITVILNSYRRCKNLESQIDHLRNQTVPPKEIWLWINDHEDNSGFDFHELDVDRIFDTDHNWKFYGRFSISLLAQTEYVAVFDDDTIPGLKWFENCLETMSVSEGLLGGAGVILKGDEYLNHERVGWPSQNEDIVEVDLVGHAWFFKRDWAHYLWTERPFSWDNGEDIQFSYSLQKHAGIPTYCPPHPEKDKDLHSSLYPWELGTDEKASAENNKNVFYKQRDECIRQAKSNGWETINEVLSSPMHHRV